MKIFLSLAILIAVTSASLISQPVVGFSSLGVRHVPVVSVRNQPSFGYNSLAVQRIPVVSHVRTLNHVAYSSPVVATRVVSPVLANHVISSPVVYSSPVVTSHIVAAPVAYRSSPVLTNVISPINVAHRRLVHTPL